MMTAETKAKMSAAHMGHPYYGPEHRPDEVKERISAGMMGKTNSLGTHHSDETRAKMSAAGMGNKRSLGKVPPNKGIPMTDEQRAKLSVAHWKGGLKVAEARHRAKRCEMGFVPLNKRFNGADGHHIDAELVIYMPRKLHQSIYHNHFTGLRMAQINAIAYNFLFKQEVEAALEDKREQLA